jgi:hypothetical protein
MFPVDYQWMIGVGLAVLDEAGLLLQGASS